MAQAQVTVAAVSFGFDGPEEAERFASKLNALVHEWFPWYQPASGLFAVTDEAAEPPPRWKKDEESLSDWVARTHGRVADEAAEPKEKP